MNAVVTPPNPLPEPSQPTVQPEEDARLPILENEIENQWAKFRKPLFRQLKASGELKQQIRLTALQCIHVLNQYQERGLGPDMGRETIQELIIPPQD